MPRDSRLYMTFPNDDDLWPYARCISPDAYVYLVEWPDGVVKVGLAGRPSRWRKLVTRGGVARMIVRSSARRALDLEIATQQWLDEASVPRAFQWKEESLAYLGDGSGWTECYRAPGWAVEQVIKGEVERALVQG